MHVRTGDTVVVLSGKDRGKRGRVIRVLPREGRVVVEGVNVVKKHQRPGPKVMQAGIISQEAPIPASRVQLICKSCHRPARTGKKKVEGKSLRYCKKCGEIVDE